MKILHLTDIHANIEKTISIISEKAFDFLVLSGDITHFGKKKELNTILGRLKNYTTNILAVSGNCDFPECSEHLKNEGYSVGSKIKTVQGYQFIGLEGSLKCPGTTPNEFMDEDYGTILKKLETQIDPEIPLILITHQPPHKTKNDKVFMGFHVGSKVIRRFIEKYQPVACLTGHIHEGKGTDLIGKCIIVNPGPAKDGAYALIELSGKTPPKVSLF